VELKYHAQHFGIGAVSGDELARAYGYAGATDAFRSWCRTLRISHVPGRPGYFDPKLVRLRLDAAQGMLAVSASFVPANDPLEARRARNGS
jgi:hypothetical protein